MDAINTLGHRQNGRHFADDILKCIFLNEIVWIAIKISLKFIPKGPINNIPSLVQIMAWRRPGDKPLSEAMMVNLPTHICVTRPQWVKHPCPNCKCNLAYTYTNLYSGVSSSKSQPKCWLTHLLLVNMATILADDIFKCIFLNAKVQILIKISLKFVPKGLIDHNQGLVWLMVWRPIGDKPLSEPMLTRFSDTLYVALGEDD